MKLIAPYIKRPNLQIYKVSHDMHHVYPLNIPMYNVLD